MPAHGHGLFVCLSLCASLNDLLLDRGLFNNNSLFIILQNTVQRHLKFIRIIVIIVIEAIKMFGRQGGRSGPVDRQKRIKRIFKMCE